MCTLRLGSLVPFGLAIGLAGLPSAAAAQAVELTMYVSALDREGAPVEKLSPDDVLVREDGVAREVLRVARATAPMQVAVLVDNSAATEPDISNLREAILQFAKTMAPGNEVSIVAYADRPTILTNPTSNLQLLEQGVGRIFAQPNSGSYVLDAIVETSRGFVKRGAGRPVIVLFATEAAEFSHADEVQVLDELAAAGAALHALVLTRGGGGNLSNTEVRNRNVAFDRGTRETGGQRVNLLTSMGYKAVAETLATELRAQFEVVFARPQLLIPPSKTTVESASPDITVRGMLARAPSRVPGA